MVLVWKPEDNLKELVFFFHHVGLNSGGHSGQQAAGPAESLIALLQHSKKSLRTDGPWPQLRTKRPVFELNMLISSGLKSEGTAVDTGTLSDLVITCEAAGTINSNDTDDFSGFHIESRLGFRPCPCVAGTSLDSRETGVMFICVTDRSRQADPS